MRHAESSNCGVHRGSWHPPPGLGGVGATFRPFDTQPAPLPQFFIAPTQHAVILEGMQFVVLHHWYTSQVSELQQDRAHSSSVWAPT